MGLEWPSWKFLPSRDLEGKVYCKIPLSQFMTVVARYRIRILETEEQMRQEQQEREERERREREERERIARERRRERERWKYNVRLGIAFESWSHTHRGSVSGRWEPSPPDFSVAGQRFISTEGPHPAATRFSLRQQADPGAPYLTISYFD